MGDGRSQDEERLLARLNALKPSSISLDAAPTITSSKVEEGNDDTSDDLITRFQQLYGRQSKGGVETPSVPSSPAQAVEQGLPSPTIEELLAELGADNSNEMDKSEEIEARKLMAEAKPLLPENPTDREADIPSEKVDDTALKPIDEENDDAEAEAALQRILDDAEQDPDEEEEEPNIKHSTTTHRPGAKRPIDSFAELQFPSTPDDDLGASQLPSAPTTNPSARKRQTQARSKGFSDDEINSWCVICCANAAVQCFGCNKDLYCWGCWREGHMGADAGLAERTHVWERYSKPTK